MKTVKYIVLTIMGMLLIATIAMLNMGAWMPVLGVGAGILFIYYSVIYVLIMIAKNRTNKVFDYIIYFLVFAPLIWAIIDGQGMIDGFMHNALKDFRYEI